MTPENLIMDNNVRLLRLLQDRGYKASAARSRSPAGRWQLRATEAPSFSFEFATATINPLTEFQRFYGLTESGKLDAETTDLLLAPRCGVPDPVGPQALRSGTGGWPTRQLTFAFENSLIGFPDSRIRSVISKAFLTWSNASLLAFREVAADAHISIRFGGGNHNDDFPFDGPEGELAHAFFPDHRPRRLAGQVHFDADENWSIDEFCPPEAKDLLSVAIHEIGHAVGLDHVGIRSSVMFSNYQGMQRTLYPFDVEAINVLYT